MNTLNNFETIKNHFQNAVNLQQTCKIHITSIDHHTWDFYFKSGCLVWGTSSEHRFRRLYRLIGKYVPELDCYSMQLREKEISELWEYLFLQVLIKRQRATLEQIVQIIKEAIVEILFDCIQSASKIDKIKCIFETSANHMGGILRSPLLKNTIAQIDVKLSLSRVTSGWDVWHKAKLTNYSPNLAPIVTNKLKLQQVTEPEIYQNFLAAIDGHKTLRDLSVLAQQDVFTLTRTLIPHIKTSLIKLQTVDDVGPNNLWTNNKTNSQREQIRESGLPLVMCVDDNPQICRQITQILNPSGYRLIAINDSTQVLTILLDSQPDLIFLNCAMPLVNGYELCSQIRKMPGFKKLPIIMLSDNDSIIDKTRAKMAGASDLIAKPMNPKEVLALTVKHLLDNTDAKTITSQLTFSEQSV
jgi:chemotaxis family two-component system response regulator PixG